MCGEDLGRILTNHEPHVAVLLESESLLGDLFNLVEVEVLAWRRVRDCDESTAVKSAGEVVHNLGQEVSITSVAIFLPR
jgi:hypothetical protein